MAVLSSTTVSGTLNVTGTISQNGTAVSLNGHNHSFNDLTNKPDQVTITVTYSDGTTGTFKVYYKN